MNITIDGQILDVTESFAGSPTVDREQGVVRGIKILGKISVNEREYTTGAIKKAASLYEGKGVYADHPSRPDDQRKVGDRLGWLEGVLVKPDGLYGDLHVLKSHPMADSVFESAERNPRLFGLSHNAKGKSRRHDGKIFVEEIQGVRSVDLVAEPATTHGLFESRENPMPKTVREILESLDQKDKCVEWLTNMTEEEAPLAMAAEAPVEAPAEANGDEQMKAAFRAALVAAFDDASLDTKATLKKIGEVLKAYEKLTSKPDAEPAPEETPAEEEKSTTESKDHELAAKVAKLEGRDKARDLMEAAGVIELDAEKREVLIEALAALPTDKARKTLVESFKGKSATTHHPKPRSGVTTFRESLERSSDPEQDAKSFAQSLR